MFKLCLLGLFATAALYGVEGTYAGSGTDPLTKEAYMVTATFTQDDNGIYQATWDEAQKGKDTHYTGTGLQQGDFMSFVYQNEDDASDTGLQIYKIKGNALEGRFVMIGENAVGNEKLSLKK